MQNLILQLHLQLKSQMHTSVFKITKSIDWYQANELWSVRFGVGQVRSRSGQESVRLGVGQVRGRVGQGSPRLGVGQGRGRPGQESGRVGVGQVRCRLGQESVRLGVGQVRRRLGQEAVRLGGGQVRRRLGQESGRLGFTSPIPHGPWSLGLFIYTKARDSAFGAQIPLVCNTLFLDSNELLASWSTFATKRCAAKNGEASEIGFIFF